MEPVINPNKDRTKKSLSVTWIAQIVGVFSFLTWSFSAAFGVMLFAGNPNWQTKFLFSLLLFMPVANLIASLCLWIAYWKTKSKLWTLSCIWLILSPLPLLLFQ